MNKIPLRLLRPTLAALLAVPVLALAASDDAVPDAPMPPPVGDHMAPMAPMPPMAPMGMGEHGDWGMGMGGPMHRLRMLDLSEEQQDKVFALHHGQEERMYQLRKQIRQAGEALRDMAQGAAFDATKARAMADQLGRATADMALLHADMGAKVYALLTPEQRAKLDRFKESRGPMRREIRREVHMKRPS